ncbi:DNA adenine methylase [Levilactobacillus angrenensis]|uniref:site-specific DNA-methyltransferase (adenine-specific) n=1 Tax=Levilactobacillus angrenensis TaxID=2486020 RepID=A0ABW1UC08_9LACO|nr:Dam family site-specific DNA-(adenine-N6)-methyltransferase [Levilactobacillus angrenensis]
MAILRAKPLEISPLIKWAGGKKRLAAIIQEEAEKKVDFENIDTYVEPFAGGASMFLHLASKYEFKRQVIMDINPALINLYRQVRDNLREVTAGLDKIQVAYNALPENDDFEAKKAYFYEARTQFNKILIDGDGDLIQQAVLFIFLNKTDFNGLYRVNSKGLFNVPFGRRKSINLYDNNNIHQFSKLLQNTEILLGDYRNTGKYIGDRTFFYFDPPYRPLTDSASFTSYAKSTFNDDSQRELATYVMKIANAGTHFALSNSDPHQSDKNDDFFDNLYKDFTICRIQAARMISARARGRGSVSELVITN